MKKYDTVIWDLDGTLLDTLDDILDSVNEAMHQFGLPARTRAEVRSFVGNGIGVLMELSIPGGKAHAQFKQVSGCFVAHYSKNSRNKTKPYEGIEQILNACVQKGIKMGIVSNKGDAIVKDLAQLYFKGSIPVAIGARPGIRNKPAADSVLEAMRELHAKQETTLYIGDSEVDVLTAQNAELDGVFVDWGFRDAEALLQAGAKQVLHTPAQLAEFLARNT